MSSAASLLSLYGRGYVDLSLQRLVVVGEGLSSVTPSQDLLGSKLPSGVYLSRMGREGN
jgi:hypothetical protein